MNLAAFYAAQHTYPAENKQLDSYKWIHDMSYNILAQIRLLDFTTIGNNFPLTIDSIVLCPKIKGSLINREQIGLLIG